MGHKLRTRHESSLPSGVWARSTAKPANAISLPRPCSRRVAHPSSLVVFAGALFPFLKSSPAVPLHIHLDASLHAHQPRGVATTLPTTESKHPSKLLLLMVVMDPGDGAIVPHRQV